MAAHHDGINPHAASVLLRQAMQQKYVSCSSRPHSLFPSTSIPSFREAGFPIEGFLARNYSALARSDQLWSSSSATNVRHVTYFSSKLHVGTCGFNFGLIDFVSGPLPIHSLLDHTDGLGSKCRADHLPAKRYASPSQPPILATRREISCSTFSV